MEGDGARQSGIWLFKGTRVPVAALLENLEVLRPQTNLSSGLQGSLCNKCVMFLSMLHDDSVQTANDLGGRNSAAANYSTRQKPAGMRYS